MSFSPNLPPNEYLDLLSEAKHSIETKLLLCTGTPLANPRVLIICGSGLGGIADILHNEPKVEIKYDEIPGFQTSTVAGHAGKLILGLIGENKVPVICMVGRLHFYEGYNFQQTTFPIRLCKKLGVKTVVVTNAAGGINENYKPGDLMIINDHINLPGLAGFHALRGPNLEEFGPRFQPMSDAYSHSLRKLFFETAKSLKVTRRIYEGTYFFAAGPTFESRAEVRMIRTLGGDAVGMSTVPEVVVARHCDMEVLSLSLITNAGVGEKPPSVYDEKPKALSDGMASHSEVLESASEASKDVQRIFEATINEL
ncbi:inosine guanosine and [Metschnikowia bicuspidata var. bicuspidata NRRL YB-4993]|uniref:Purine nucleoside phosphorylase n=1 Tax=Metschnikowia bicuspidata var. bicuspidata NRRL YB-4993 TaxID=869754 RepID=A0A1A0HL24_9ASCO|nr:inosine guanosine and [Metschnikowia bicuspidata var. bicuspidata NRRL YB-4993]OBA24508.1 inosine guanosine and [Metschnikowia bicuspidata var. bicuspidata NRRL YB-4993]